MLLAIDIGNSRVKVGLFAGDHLEGVHYFSHTDFSAGLLALLSANNLREKVKYLGCASVGNKELMRQAEAVAAALPHASWLAIGHQTPLPIQNGYGSPETLGMDRICACVGAYVRFRRSPLLTIDAGTAITYDFVDAEAVYRGGGIAPGLRLRFRALNDHTAALPLVSTEGPSPLVGYNTVTSIRSGVVNGLLAEIDGLIGQYHRQYGGQCEVFLTGGDADFLGNHLKNINFVDPNLLLYGIHAVITYNLSNAT